MLIERVRGAGEFQEAMTYACVRLRERDAMTLFSCCRLAFLPARRGLDLREDAREDMHQLQYFPQGSRWKAKHGESSCSEWKKRELEEKGYRTCVDMNCATCFHGINIRLVEMMIVDEETSNRASLWGAKVDAKGRRVMRRKDGRWGRLCFLKAANEGGETLGNEDCVLPERHVGHEY